MNMESNQKDDTDDTTRNDEAQPIGKFLYGLTLIE